MVGWEYCLLLPADFAFIAIAITAVLLVILVDFVAFEGMRVISGLRKK